MVWQDGRDSTTSGVDIYAQRIARDGMLLGNNFPVSTAPGAQTSPAVAYTDRDNQYLVAWVDGRDAAASQDDIYGQRVSGDGARLGDALAIAVAPGRQFKPAIAFNPGGRYLVVWYDERHRAEGIDTIYGQGVPTEGAVPESHFLIAYFPIATDTRIQGGPSVIYHQRSREYLVVWEDVRNLDTSGSDIFGQRVSAAEALVGENLPIATARLHQFRPSLAYDHHSRQCLVVWQELNPSTSASGNDIHGRIVR